MVKNKKYFHKLEQRRQRLVKYLLSNVKLICGSYSDVLVKCGRAGCHCQKKPSHPVTRLEIRTKEKRQNKVVRVNDREHVKKLVNVYKEHKKILKELIQIQNEQKAFLQNLILEKDEGY